MPNADKCHLNIPYKDTARANLTFDEEGMLRREGLERFNSELFENLKEIERRINNKACRGSGISRPYATYVVAAPNSQHPDSANADFQGGSSAIQAAVSALDSQLGGLVLLLDGEFEMAADVTIGNSNVQIAGMGAATQLLCDSSDRFPLTFYTAYRPSVRDLAIVGTFDTGIYLGSCESPIIRGVWIGDGLGEGDYGMLTEDTDHLNVSGVKFYGVGTGIWSGGNDAHFVLANNGFEAIGNIGLDFNHAGAMNGLVIGNIIEGPTTAGVNFVASASDVSVTGNLLLGCTNGVVAGAGVARVLVANNTFRNITTDFTGTVDKGAGNYLDGTWTP